MARVSECRMLHPGSLVLYTKVHLQILRCAQSTVSQSATMNPQSRPSLVIPSSLKPNLHKRSVEVELSKTPWWYETSSGAPVQYEQTMSKYVEHWPVITSLTLPLAPRTSASLRDHAQDLNEAPCAHATTFETPAKYPSCRHR